MLNDKCPIKYVTYKQTSVDEEEEVGVHKAESIISTSEIKIEEYGYNASTPTTRTANYVRRHISMQEPDSEEDEEDSDQDSGETEGADDSQAEIDEEYSSESDSDNEHVTDSLTRRPTPSPRH